MKPMVRRPNEDTPESLLAYGAWLGSLALFIIAVWVALWVG